MCGIFGVLVDANLEFSPRLLNRTVKDLFRLSESRGKEAAGVAMSTIDTIQVYKAPASGSVLIQSEPFKKAFTGVFERPLISGGNAGNTNLIIGHSRLVTDGNPEVHLNNQPVIKDGIVGIHNGIITNKDSLWKQYQELDKKYEIDTEILLSLIRFFYREKGELINAVRKSYSLIEGVASIALLFEDLDQLLLSTNNGSLYLYQNRDYKLCIFASERSILKSIINKRYLRKYIDSDEIIHGKPGTGYLVDPQSIQLEEFSLLSGNSSTVTAHRNSFLKEIIDIKKTDDPGNTAQSDTTNNIPTLWIESFRDEFSKNENRVDKLRRCTKCILPETMPFIEFDDDGVCNYCNNHQKIELRGLDALEKVIAPYRSFSGEQDCIVSFSGGRDSSYGVHFIKTVLNMNPITYTYDWGMITDLGRRNQMRICGKLGLEHILVSANINWKRRNIRKNVNAWLRKPDLGTVALFMAGDKQYFYHANKVGKQTGCNLVVLCESIFEIAKFKFGFCGIQPNFSEKNAYAIKLSAFFQMAYYYGKRYFTNPGYINSSILDTIFAYICFFGIQHNYLNIYEYIEWDEETINSTLISNYNWEVAEDTPCTWRIGDGTASFYNYIYYTMAGFTENDTLRSNQIREGVISREKAMELVKIENLPRYESIQWYCSTIGIDFKGAIQQINTAPKLYAS